MSKRNKYSWDERDSPEDIKEIGSNAAVRELATICRAMFSGVEDPLWEPTSTGLREQIDAAQHDKDIWKPVSPALAKRIEAAVGSWTVRRGKDFYSEVAGNAGKPKRLNDEDLWGVVSVAITKMEDYFAEVLEHLPPTGAITVIPENLHAIDDPTFVPENYIPEDDIDYTVITAVAYAIRGLAHAASCRRDIGAKRTASAVFEMSVTTELYWVTRTTLRDDAAIPLIEAGHRSLALKARGRKASREKKREKIKTRAGDWRRLHHQGWADSRIWKWIAAKDEITADTARNSVKNELKKQEAAASIAPADT